MPAIIPTPRTVEARALAVLTASGEPLRYSDLARALTGAQRRLLWGVLHDSPRFVVEQSPRGGHVVGLREGS